MLKSLLGWLAAILLLLATPTAANAHAQLLSTTPAQNAVIQSAPSEVILAFNEPVKALVLSLIAADGTQTDLLPTARDGGTVTIPLPTDLPTGTHVLNWRVISVDAHPIGGALIFSVGTKTDAPVATSDQAPIVAVAIWAAKALLYVALFFGVGASVFALAAPLPSSARKLGLGLSLAGIVLAPITLGLQGVDALGLVMPEIITAAPWVAALQTTYGPTAVLLTAAFALSALALGAGRLQWLSWLAWAAAGLALSISGHAGAAEPQWLTRPAVALHIAGTLFWGGALVPLLVLLKSNANDALAQFSRFAPFAVAPVLASGVALAVIQLGPPSDQWLAPYGILLGCKLILVTILLGIALLNRQALTTPALAGDEQARNKLRMMIVAEIIIILAVLGLVSGWRFTPPPRALQTAVVTEQAEPIYLHLMDDKVMGMATIIPGTTGASALELFITTPEGEPLAPLSVAISLSSPSLGVEPFSLPAHLEDEMWRVDNLTIPLPGTWSIRMEVRVSRFVLSRTETEFDIE